MARARASSSLPGQENDVQNGLQNVQNDVVSPAVISSATASESEDVGRAPPKVALFMTASLPAPLTPPSPSKVLLKASASALTASPSAPLKPPLMFGPDPSQLATLQELLDYDRQMLARKAVAKQRRMSSSGAQSAELEMPLIIQRSLDFLMEKGLNAEGTLSITRMILIIQDCFVFQEPRTSSRNGSPNSTADSVTLSTL